MGQALYGRMRTMKHEVKEMHFQDLIYDLYNVFYFSPFQTYLGSAEDFIIYNFFNYPFILARSPYSVSIMYSLEIYFSDHTLMSMSG